MIRLLTCPVCGRITFAAWGPAPGRVLLFRAVSFKGVAPPGGSWSAGSVTSSRHEIGLYRRV